MCDVGLADAVVRFIVAEGLSGIDMRLWNRRWPRRQDVREGAVYRPTLQPSDSETRMPQESENPPVVLINVFTVEPKNQQRLIDILTSATHGSVDQEPGFISATLHRSLDGSKVTMYATWRDAEAYAAMRRKPGRPFLAQALEIAKFEPGMYEVVRTFLAPTANNSASGAER